MLFKTLIQSAYGPAETIHQVKIIDNLTKQYLLHQTKV